MKIVNIDVEIDYHLLDPGPAILILEAAATAEQEIVRASIDVESNMSFARVPAEEGIGEKIILSVQDRLRCHYKAEIRLQRPWVDLSALDASEMHNMSADALRYLLPSYYCDVQHFQPFVTQRFGHLKGGAKVAAMRAWIERKLDYVPGSSGPETTALDTFVQRRGICRDYAHLLTSFCRAAQVPARFVSCYADSVEPPDFHALVEAYLEGAWHIVDPTGMASAESTAIISVGRDATDVAFLTTAGESRLVNQQVRVRG